MTAGQLPAEGSVVVVTDRPGDWAAVVADRNAKGFRTALLVAPGDSDASDQAEQMADEVFRGADWVLVDTRRGA